MDRPNGSNKTGLKVFKFGGASIRDAASIRNLGKVLELFIEEDLVLVVSAIGKTTNALETIAEHYCSRNEEEAFQELEALREAHQTILDGLFHEPGQEVYIQVDFLFEELKRLLAHPPALSYDAEYDRIVPFGELIASTIVSHFLEVIAHHNKWFDARQLIRTDDTHRRARVDWSASKDLIHDAIGGYLQHTAGRRVAITQGFIGHSGKATTTLGREGSDYSAAILGYLIDASSVTIWKDVPGILNADPRYFADHQKLDKISYREAIELSYYGAKVIHPRTIQPLENKGIPLYVKSFLNPRESGTVIQENMDTDHFLPTYILKTHQVLLSITPRDFSFVVETDLSHIFDRCARTGVSINLMQNSAINFSISVDDTEKIPRLMEELDKNYEVRYNTGLELLTIRHYDEETLEKLTSGRNIFLEQKTRHTARFIMKSK